MSENALIACQRHLRDVRAVDLPLVQRAVYLALAGRANEQWIAFPALLTLAQDAGTSAVSTVRRALDWLVEHNWIEIVTPATPRDSARYRLRRVSAATPQGERSATSDCAERSPSGVAESAPRVSGALSEGERSAHPEVAERSARGSGALTEDHRKVTEKIQKKICDASEEEEGEERKESFPGTLSLFPDSQIEPTTDPVLEVWGMYLEARTALHLRGGVPILDDKRRALIAARLAQMALADVLDAARGVFMDPWHVGKRKFEPEYVFRDVAHVEKFRDFARGEGGTHDDDPSAAWPESQPGAIREHVGPPPPRPKSDRPPETPEQRARFEELRKLSISELRKMQAQTMGLWGPEHAFGPENI